MAGRARTGKQYRSPGIRRELVDPAKRYDWRGDILTGGNARKSSRLPT